MDNKLQRLNSLIDFFKLERKSKDNRIDTKESLPALIELLKKEKEKFFEKNLDKLKTNIQKNFKKLRISALSLMQYNWNENTHSNILQYLLDYDSFEQGAEFLRDIIKLSCNKIENDLFEKILKKSYIVYREYSIPSGRIDLLILDQNEKFVIIIENKISAGIGLDTIIENEESKKISQLEKYKKWCEKEYSDDYSKSYILLSFDNIDDTLYDRISYKQLYSILGETDEIMNKINLTDNIFDEYMLLLDSLLNYTVHDLSEIKKLANMVRHNENPEMSLTDYYTLKNIFYA